MFQLISRQQIALDQCVPRGLLQASAFRVTRDDREQRQEVSSNEGFTPFTCSCPFLDQHEGKVEPSQVNVLLQNLEERCRPR